MPDPEAVYAEVAAGQPLPPLSPQEAFLVLGRAERAVQAVQVSDRLAGLRVAAAFGGRDGLRVVGLYIKDADRVVRRAALDAAIAAQDEALPVVREAVADPDPALAYEALQRLTLAVDKASTTRARTALRSTSAPVRAAAATLLGHIAGAAVRPELKGLSADTDAMVRNAAEQALDRIEGRKERNVPAPWWGAVELMPSSPEEAPIPKPVSAPTPQAPPTATGDLTAAKALLRRAGEENPLSDETVRALRAFDGATLLAAGQEYKPGGEPQLGRGFAVAARVLDRADWASAMRRLTGDANATVKAAAIDAYGVIARGLAAMNPLIPFLTDTQPAVRAATIRALDGICSNLGRRDLLVDRLKPLAEDADAEVKTLARRALGMGAS